MRMEENKFSTYATKSLHAFGKADSKLIPVVNEIDVKYGWKVLPTKADDTFYSISNIDGTPTKEFRRHFRLCAVC